MISLILVDNFYRKTGFMVQPRLYFAYLLIWSSPNEQKNDRGYNVQPVVFYFGSK